MVVNDIDYFPTNLEFAVFSSEDIRQISVVKVITGLTFDALGFALPGGLYDNLMGTYGRSREPCHTCRNINDCPGHIGHIELNALVYNPFFMRIIQKVLSLSCVKCFRLQIKDYVVQVLLLQLRLIEAGYIVEAQELEIYKSEAVYQSAKNMIKMEDGSHAHPRIAELQSLLKDGKSNMCNKTKSSCAIRTGIVNTALQRPKFNKCLFCSKSLFNIRIALKKLTMYLTAAELNSNNPESNATVGRNKVIIADECRKYLRSIYENDSDLLKLLFPVLKLTMTTQNPDFCPFDLFFMDTVPVTPPKARPTNFVNDKIQEHSQTALYRSVIENNSVLRVVMRHITSEASEMDDNTKTIFKNLKGETASEKLYNAWQALQTAIDVILDVTVSKDPASNQGLKQILEKKDGLIRKHMMGKRVNYAARTVITPDPNINVDEIGMPDVFARRLSYPVPVTSWNLPELRKMVMNGPNVHPGANYIQDDKGTIVIPADNPAKRESMAKLLFSQTQNGASNGVKVVHRHVLNGDILLLNRQPSLHKPSIMAHKARILPGEKTFRLHYSNCKAYNADFDGDEMNAHYPQNEIARAEAYNLVNVASNYLVPKDGTPLGGLIQDHIISGVKLSLRGRFFNREDYQQLVFQGLSNIKGDIVLLPPAIMRPLPLWSGKQILSTIIINLIPKGEKRINLYTVTKIADKEWNVCRSASPQQQSHTFQAMSESKVIIKNGELLCGVLDKNQYGASTYGLIHCLYELYGGEVSTRCLTAFTKLFTSFLQNEGFTLGVKDILVTKEADSKRQAIIKECCNVGSEAVAAALDLEDAPPPLDELTSLMEHAYIKDPKFRITLDRKYKAILDNYTNSINKTCLPEGLITKFPSNNLQLMVLSGAKGSMVNTMQISCLLGQIELEGKRPPLMISGKSLPSFTSFETSPKSGGFIDGRFMTGIQPQDFFFHCMAGREGLIDTAVKTSRSGYLQRCLIKHLEGLTVNYDLTVRDSDNSVVQYLYGEDGLDILKSKFLVGKVGPEFLRHNEQTILNRKELELIKDDEILTKVLHHEKKIRSWRKKHGGCPKRDAFTHFSAELRDDVEVDEPFEINVKTGRLNLDEGLVKLWQKADEEYKAPYEKKFRNCPDPTAFVYKQDNCYGSVSEYLQKMIDEHCRTSNDTTENKFSDIIYLKNLKALAAPGDPVGLLAAQSIGEPSTQMTLNTFHFAGRGEMNVTLGIPRLREILMLASSNIKTPTMDIPILKTTTQDVNKLRIKFNCVTVADLLEYVNVKSKLVLQPERAYQYTIHFQFLPREAYQDEFSVRPKRVLKYMHKKFFHQLFRAVVKSSKNDFIEEEKAKKKSSKEAEQEDDQVDAADDQNTKDNKEAVDSSDDEGGVNDDDDATGIRLKTRKQDEADYDDPDDVEELEDANAEEEVDENELCILDDDVAAAAAEEHHKKMTEVLLNNSMVESYIYDKEEHLWCEIRFNVSTNYKKQDFSNIIRLLARKSVIHQVQNIKRAIIYKNDKDEDVLKTDGINIVEMFKYTDTLDMNRFYSNDIQAVLATYGIEAATQVIIKEIGNVFKVYGITVDRRHLSLVADYMTCDGTFKPLSRKGMENSSSPLQQMSFESCMQFLRIATQFGQTDELQSPSSRLMVGLPIKNGTGAFELLTKIC